MKGRFFVLAAMAFAAVLVPATAFGQLINELGVNPGGTDNPCEYVELIGTPGAAIENIHFVSLEGDTNKGLATAVITFGVPGPVFGSNGLAVVVSSTPCGSRTYPAGTTVLTTSLLDAAGGALQNGSNSFLLISSVTPIVANTDYDTNDDGTLDALPAGAVILDGVAWSDGGATDVLYGSAILSAAGGTIGGATRFPGNTTANSAAAFYGGALFGAPEATTYSETIRTANFPTGGALTPGAPNVGSVTVVNDVPLDMNGDGKTDYVVIRPVGGNGVWYTLLNGIGPIPSTTWGVEATDLPVPADYDGDGKDDIAVWRSGAVGNFYILQSGTSTVRVEQFGQTGDNPFVVNDYDGNGTDDVAVYREGVNAGDQSTWYVKVAAGYYPVLWGNNGDVPAPGDYDGDGKADFVVKRAEGAVGVFHKLFSTGVTASEAFGTAVDLVVPGDYDGDGKTDLATVRATLEGTALWSFEPSGTAGSTVVSDTWGDINTDFPVQGDYDGDGATDFAVWRETTGTFHVMAVGPRVLPSVTWGQPGDFPAAAFFTFLDK